MKKKTCCLRLLTAALLAGFTPSALLSSEYKDNFDNGAEKGVKGNAVMVGSNSQPLLKLDGARDVIQPGSGTVSFWFKPTGWDAGSKPMICLFMARSPEKGWIQLYKYEDVGKRSAWSNKLIFLYGSSLRDPQGKPAFRLAATPRITFRRNEFHHVAFTWTPEKITLYLDGKPAAAGTVVKPADGKFTDIQLGAPTSPEAATVVDELHIYSRALDGKDIFALFEKEREQKKSSLEQVTIGKISGTVPNADGKIVPGEYPVELSMMHELQNESRLSPRPSTFHCGYDDSKFYFAAVTDGKSLNANGQNAAVCWDDAVELYLKPAKDGALTQWIINSAGEVYTEQNGKSRLKIPGFRVKNHVENGKWIVEGEIPFAGLGVSAPKDGDIWKFNFCRTFTAPKLYYTSLGVARGNYASGIFDLTFRQNAPSYSAVLGAPDQNRVDVHISPVKGAKVTAVGDTGEVQKLSAENGNSLALPSERGMISIDLPGLFRGTTRYLPEPKGRFQYRYLYTDVAKKTMHVCLAQPDPLMDGQSVPGSFALIDEKGNMAASSRFTNASVEAEIPFDYGKCAPGKYTLRIERNAPGQSGRLLWRHDTEYVIWPDGTTPWHNNRIGVSNRVPPPWTPLTVSGNSEVSVWNRQFRFRPDDLFFTSILSGGKELLQSPMRLIGTVDGKRLTARASSLKIIPGNETFCTVEASGKLGKLDVAVHTKIEFDGFAWIEISFGGGVPVKLENLAFEWTMPREAAELRNFGDYKLQRTGTLPKGVTHKDLLNDSPLFWLGGNGYGLQWVAEDLKNYYLKKNEQALTIRNSDNLVAVSVAIFDSPVTVGKKRTIAFGIEPTPCRPSDPNMRNVRMWQNTRINFNELFNLYNYPDTAFLNPPQKAELDRLQKSNVVVAPYAACGAASQLSPEYKYYGEFWRLTPPPEGWERIRPDRKDLGSSSQTWEHLLVCPCDDYTDFYLSKFAPTYRKLGLKGWYMDWADARFCDNALHGHGWTDWTGKRRGTYNFRSIRDMAMRIRNVMQEANPGSLYFLHASGVPIAPAHGFCDIFVDGENIADKVGLQMNYFKILPLNTFLAGYDGSQWGWQDLLLPQFTRIAGLYYPDQMKFYNSPAASKVYNHLIGLVMVHDSLVHSIFGVDQTAVFNALKTFGWDEKVHVHPYYNNASVIRKMAPESPDAVISCFERPDKVLLLPFNNTDSQTEFAVKILPGAFAGKPCGRFLDLITKEKFDVLDGVLRCSVPEHAFRLLMGINK